MRACARQSKHNVGNDVDKIVDALLDLRAAERSRYEQEGVYQKPVADMSPELYPTPRGSAMIAAGRGEIEGEICPGVDRKECDKFNGNGGTGG